MEIIINNIRSIYNWRSPSLSELTQMIFKTEFTHLGSEVSNQIKWLSGIAQIAL